MINNICTKRDDQHKPRTRTTLPTVMAHRQHGYMPSPETHLRIGRSHITPAGRHARINSRSTHISLLTRAASEHARPHVPPNLALILAWTYGAVARALGSLVEINPTASNTFADSSFHHETGSSIYRPGKGQTKSRLATMHIWYIHNTTQPATVRWYYRDRRHF